MSVAVSAPDAAGAETALAPSGATRVLAKATIAGWLLTLGERLAVRETDGVTVADASTDELGVTEPDSDGLTGERDSDRLVLTVAVSDWLGEELAVVLAVADEVCVALVLALTVSDGERLLLIEEEPVALFDGEAELLEELDDIGVGVSLTLVLALTVSDAELLEALDDVSVGDSLTVSVGELDAV